jgi:hypothetical protein
LAKLNVYLPQRAVEIFSVGTASTEYAATEERRPVEFGTWIASMPGMTDERYLVLLLWTICVLVFACSVVALTQHPDWFGA